MVDQPKVDQDPWGPNELNLKIGVMYAILYDFLLRHMNHMNDKPFLGFYGTPF